MGSSNYNLQYQRDYNNANPWLKTYRNIQRRCCNKTHRCYTRYGGRGIKNFLRPSDLKFLWFRDNAGSMKNPSIDRIDVDGNYTMENCRYIERSINISSAMKGKIRVKYGKTKVCVLCNKNRMITSYRLEVPRGHRLKTHCVYCEYIFGVRKRQRAKIASQLKIMAEGE